MTAMHRPRLCGPRGGQIRPHGALTQLRRKRLDWLGHRKTERLAVADIETAVMDGARHLMPLDESFSQRSLGVRASVLRCVELPLDIEDRNWLHTGDLDRPRLAVRDRAGFN